MDEREEIAEFIAGECFAVAGASNDREKYGNKVPRCYWQSGRDAPPATSGLGPGPESAPY